jgi:riboflavin synthase
MFSGIVEVQGRVLHAHREEGLVFIDVERPEDFDDLRIGDSVCTSGVCLTVESFNEKSIRFALGNETLAVTGWSTNQLQNQSVNLERSLRLGDRIHGHMVSGHVDATGTVVQVKDLGGSVQVDIQAPESIARYLWKKGSWAVNGVSLTINDVSAKGIVSQCLIPETLRRTNLGNLQGGDRVNLEIDMMARGLVSFLESRESAEPTRGENT